MLYSKPPLFRVHLFGYVFAPTLIPMIITLFLLPILVSLGLWQLDRAQQKQNLLTQFYAGLHAKPISVQDLHSPLSRWRFHPIQLTGFYDNEHSFLLDNKFYQHRVGYHVLTPLILSNHRVILINRGWIPLQNRKLLPILKPIYERQTIHGLIDVPNPKPFLLKHINDSDTWPRRIQAIEMSQLNYRKYPLYPFIVLLSPGDRNGFVRNWQPIATTMPPARHTAYAIQWFSLALTLFIIFIVVNSKRQKTHE